jgi:hypothetical protein
MELALLQTLFAALLTLVVCVSVVAGLFRSF